MIEEGLLDDYSRLTELDAGGLLLGAALAGAQVRATVEAASELEVDRRLTERPRAIVLVARPGVAGAVASLVAAFLGPHCPVPVVIASQIPRWVGALDVVLAHTEDSGDVELAESLERLGRHGAQVLLTAELAGPVAAAASGHALLIPPRIAVPPGFGFARAMAGWLVALKALGFLRADLTLIADELDREAERNHPGQETFVNPAKGLALRLDGHLPLLWGIDAVAAAVARHGADQLAGRAAIMADATGYQQAMTRTALRYRAVETGRNKDIFADPQVDTQQARIVLIAVERDTSSQNSLHAARQAFPSADLLEPSAQSIENDMAWAMVLALRFEFTSLYLGLADQDGGAITGHRI